MKKEQLLKGFITAVSGLGIILVLIWVFFYILTKSVIDRNLAEQTSSSSEAILYGIEEELLMLENSAVKLAAAEDLAGMLKEKEIASFYKAGGRLSEETSRISGYLQETKNAVVFDTEGRFFRLRGRLDNTALSRVFQLINGKAGGVISIGSGDQNYIGTYEPVREGQRTLGYAVLMAEEPEIERMLRTYNQSEDIGVILYSREGTSRADMFAGPSGDRILCSDRALAHTSLARIREEAVVLCEKEAGLSGFGLLLYSRGAGLSGVTSYFRVALPVTILILLFSIGLFAWYVKNRMVEPMELIKERTEKYLLKKQINAHFTVNTLNVIRALLYKGKKEEASDICDELAGLLRYANAGEDRIRLSEEFYTLEQYLGIMRTRYPGMIDVEIEEDDRYEELLVPRMLLQPIVENAITHGLAGSKGRIDISAETCGEELLVRIRDNGRGMDALRLSELRRSIADSDNPEMMEPRELRHISLQNIERRIRTEWGGKYGIEIESEPGAGTEVTVHLPVLRRASGEGEREDS